MVPNDGGQKLNACLFSCHKKREAGASGLPDYKGLFTGYFRLQRIQQFLHITAGERLLFHIDNALLHVIPFRLCGGIELGANLPMASFRAA